MTSSTFSAAPMLEPNSGLRVGGGESVKSSEYAATYEVHMAPVHQV